MQRILDIALSEDFDSIELYPLNDLHLGSQLCNLAKFHQFIKMILEKENRYIVVVGDMLNNNIIGAVGSPFEDELTPRKQKKALKQGTVCGG